MKSSLLMTLLILLIACSDQEQAISKQELDAGKEIYLDTCAVCHGISGDGEGIALPALTEKPKSILLWNESYDTETLRSYVARSTQHPAFNNNLDYQALLLFSGSMELGGIYSSK